MDWTYLAIMTAALATGAVLLRLGPRPVGLSGWEMAGIALGAFCGGMIGAKLPFVFSDWKGFLSGTAWFDDGKTIMSGLAGGYLGAEAAEWALDVRAKMCDVFAVPLAAAIAVGRLACFHAGCCYGTVTSIPWAVHFADGQPRHPTQLYESAFHLSAALVLYQFQRRRMFQGHLIRLYFVAYFMFRFATEFIRPEPALWLGLTGYQLAALLLAPFFALWCCPGCRPWLVLRRPRCRHQRATADPGYLVLKEHGTVCPICMAPVTGVTFQRDGRVYLRHQCPEHGPIEALVNSDRRHYYLRDEVPHPPLEKEICCSAMPGHKTCIALLEITGACNLACPVCFAGSSGGDHRPADEVCADLEAFLARRGTLDVLQISGGEPLLHPDLLQILDRCKRLPIEHVMINTNGLALVRDAALAAELARRRPRLELCLQLDGLDARTHRLLRGADLSAEKPAVLRKIVEHDIPTTLVCTLVKGVNEEQLGDLLRIGLETRQVRGITCQPAVWSGRFHATRDPMDRLTLADVVRLLVRQSEGLLAEDDFQPLPCSNPNCCSFTYVRRPRRGPALPLLRMVDYRDCIDRLADRINFNLADARACCGPGGRPEDFFRIVIKPFMDVHTYDQDRIDECCIHVIRPGGHAVSFCRFNALERGRAAGRAVNIPEGLHDAGSVRGS